jgi:hypothetical protein
VPGRGKRASEYLLALPGRLVEALAPAAADDMPPRGHMRYLTTLVSSVRGDLDLRRAASRADTFRAAQQLAVEFLGREAERAWLHNEVVSIRVTADPDRP